MIGERVTARARFPWSALVCLLAGLWCLGEAFRQRDAELAFMAVLPLAWTWMFWKVSRESEFALTFEPDGIVVEDPTARIPYASLRGVRIKYRSPNPARCFQFSGAIQVEQALGILHIPPRLSVPSYRVYRFLAARVPADSDALDDLEIIDTGADSRFPQQRDVNPALLDYLHCQEREFGPDDVWTFRAVSNPAEGTGHRWLKAVSNGMMLAGLIWAVVGYMGLSAKPRLDLGLMLLFFGGPIRLYVYVEDVRATRWIKNWRRAGLVLGPRGMALVQDRIEGEADWSEVTSVDYRSRRPALRSSKSGEWQSILIQMEGAAVVIADLYDRPLTLIHARIVALSGKGPAIDADAGTNANAVALLKKSPSS